MPFRVCFLVEDYYPAIHGSTTQIMLLSKSICSRGGESTIITRRLSKEHPSREELNGSVIIRVPPAIGLNRYGKFLMIIPAIIALIGNRNRYDLILVSDFKVLGVFAVLIAKLFGKKCFLRGATCGEMDGSYAFAFDDNPSPLKRWLIERLFALRNMLLKKADAFLSISRVISDELRSAGVDPRKIVDFGAAVDTERFCTVTDSERMELRERLKLPRNKYLYMYSGRLAQGKGLNHLTEAFRMLHEKHNDIALALVGSAQGHKLDYESVMRDYFTTHQLDQDTYFIGEVSNIEEYLQAADCFVFPTENEALGNSIMEASSVGLSIVASNVGGVPDVVEDGVSGKLVEPGDAAALSNAMETMYIDKDHAKALGISASKRIRNIFTVESKIRILSDLI